jgi:hypothetical protein
VCGKAVGRLHSIRGRGAGHEDLSGIQLAVIRAAVPADDQDPAIRKRHAGRVSAGRRHGCGGREFPGCRIDNYCDAARGICTGGNRRSTRHQDMAIGEPGSDGPAVALGERIGDRGLAGAGS